MHKPKHDADPLPCPFCGSEKTCWRSDFRKYAIWCYDCGAEGPQETTGDAALEKWNKRHVGVNAFDPTLYLVTDGEYSDYRLRGIYSTRQQAEHAKGVFKANNEIEEYKLDKLPYVPAGMLKYVVLMDSAGNTYGVTTENPIDGIPYESTPYGDGSTVAFVMWARDSEHAVKIANERRVRLIASGEWITDLRDWRDLMDRKKH